MKIMVLGSGQDGGLPQFGADHPHDVDARSGILLERSASSVLIETNGIRLLLDASADLRLQWWNHVGVPDAVALTHAHIGHYTGLVHFGREVAETRAVRCHISSAMEVFLTANQPWADLFRNGNLLADTSTAFEDDGYRLTMIPVPHRAEHSDTMAFSVDGRFLYLPDIDAWNEWPEARDVIGAHELAMLDGSFWSPDELDHRDQHTVPHPPVLDTIERFADLDTRIVLTHLNHTNPMIDPRSVESQRITEIGWSVARDGMIIDL